MWNVQCVLRFSSAAIVRIKFEVDLSSDNFLKIYTHWIWGSHDGDWRCYAVQSGRCLMAFWRNATAIQFQGQAACLHLADCLVYYSSLKMEAVPCSETLVNVYRIIWRHIPVHHSATCLTDSVPFFESELNLGVGVEFLASDPEARVRFPALPEKKVLGLELGPLSLVSTTEELLDRKVTAPV
jgi:hypothetical protein